MKKGIFFLLALLLVCDVFGQKTNNEIFNIIQMSREANLENGVLDPNRIWPGDYLTFLFEDGSMHVIVVELGDNQWTIVRDKLVDMEEVHGEVIPWQEDTVINFVDPKPEVGPFQREDFPWYMWIILVLLALLVLFILFSRRILNDKDPATAGPPQVSGGVNDQGAHARMSELARSRFPGSSLEIRNIRRGILSGKADVHYADGKVRRLRLNQEPGYAGEINVDGQETTIYFLQGCGNDARAGNYMTGGDLLFEPLAQMTEAGTFQPMPNLPVVSQFEPDDEDKKSSVVNPGSETFRVTTQILDMLSKQLDKNEIHEIDITTDGSKLTAKVKYKWDGKAKSASKEN